MSTIKVDLSSAGADWTPEELEQIAAAATAGPVWDYCPRWCTESEHEEHEYPFAIDGRPQPAYRIGDEARTPHYRHIGTAGTGIGVGLTRESCHLLPRAEAREVSRSTLLRLSCDVALVSRGESDEDDVVLWIAPEVARSLAAALIRGADVAEGGVA